MANEKYALLDTDFISKMHLIRKDDHNKLIEQNYGKQAIAFIVINRFK